MWVLVWIGLYNGIANSGGTWEHISKKACEEQQKNIERNMAAVNSANMTIITVCVEKK